MSGPGERPLEEAPRRPGSEGFSVPPALVILTLVVLIAAVCTWVLPAGEFERVEKRFPNWVAYRIESGDTLESINRKTGAELTHVDQIRDRSPAKPAASTASVLSLAPGTEVFLPVGGMVRNAVVPGTFRRVASEDRPPLWKRVTGSLGDAALAPMLGFVDKAQIIGFVLLLGGSFGVILATGAIDDGLAWVVLRVGSGRMRWAVIPVSFSLFSLGGAVFGLGESTIAFVLITVPLAIRLGYDTITGVAMCYMASQVGFAGAFFNPFTVGIAQGIAELPYLSGLEFRYFTWMLVTLVGIAFTMLWARRVEKIPRLSPTYEADQLQRKRLATSRSAGSDDPPRRLRPTKILVIAITFGSVMATAIGVASFGWYIDEMAGVFLVAGIACGLLSRFSPQRLTESFVRGAEMMVEPCLIIACSAGIVIVLRNGLVLDTILNSLATPLATLSPGVGSVMLMFFQAMLNFFVPSGSGQAAMTMPLVTPLCDLIGLDRQVGVLAFQFGDGFGNLLVPTSAVLMGVLGAARVPWTTWVRWAAPLVVLLHLIGAILLVVAVHAPPSWLE